MPPIPSCSPSNAVTTFAQQSAKLKDANNVTRRIFVLAIASSAALAQVLDLSSEERRGHRRSQQPRFSFPSPRPDGGSTPGGLDGRLDRVKEIDRYRQLPDLFSKGHMHDNNSGSTAPLPPPPPPPLPSSFDRPTPASTSALGSSTGTGGGLPPAS
ncbi:hypothetical protein EI94DRAFT_1799309 [Lactarius quietus]|nr:hypothetical protein EI94DRAFT_1809641 [Lactarius quietus]KAF8269404.1 hypothetical protein EI94DRAFT_1799309 [Lactarius quietus]